MARRIKELDGLRALAVSAVIVWHYVGLALPPGLQSLKPAFILGRSGVDLFFLLSGFLIGGILIHNREAKNYFSTFYLRRVLRILPPFAMLFGAYLIALNMGVKGTETPIPLWSYALFVQNFAMMANENYGTVWLGITWSLAIEEQFYLLFPLIIWLCPPKRLPLLLLLLIIGSPALRAFCVLATDAGYWAAYVATPCRLDGLALGALIAVAFADPAVWARVMAYRQRLIKVLLWMTLGLAMLALASREHWGLWGHTYLNLVYGLVLVAVLTHLGHSKLAILRSKPAGWIAAISYSAYLIHSAVIHHVFLLAGLRKTLYGPVEIGLTGLALGITLGLCTLSWRYIEAPLQRLGHRMRYKKVGAPMPGLNTPSAALS